MPSIEEIKAGIEAKGKQREMGVRNMQEDIERMRKEMNKDVEEMRKKFSKKQKKK